MTDSTLVSLSRHAERLSVSISSLPSSQWEVTLRGGELSYMADVNGNVLLHANEAKAVKSFIENVLKAKLEQVLKQLQSEAAKAMK